MSWIEDAAEGSPALALAIRDGEGQNQAIIRRNGKLAAVELAIQHLRGLGFSNSQLSQLFAHKGKASGLAQHVKELVANLK